MAPAGWCAPRRCGSGARTSCAPRRRSGAGRLRIAVRHLLPNVAAPILVAGTLGVGDVILLEAGLTYLGLGIRPPTPSLGGMVLDSRSVFVDGAVDEHLSRPRHRADGPVGQPRRRRAARCPRSPERMTPLLEVRDLRVSFPAGGGRTIHPVDGVSFSARARSHARAGRRIGLRQEPHRPGAAAPRAAARPRGRLQRDPARGQGPHVVR